MPVKVHYGAPIIEGLTPYSKIGVIDVPNARRDWPPEVDYERLERYEEFEALVENRAQDVFERLQLKEGQKTKIALALALPELLCNVWADAVWTDPPSLDWGDDNLRERWDAIFNANGGEEMGWSSVFSAAFRGTSFIRLRVDEELAAVTGEKVQIEELHPGIVFPKLKKGSDRVFDYVVLAWEEDRGGDDRPETWQVRQVHALNGENSRYRIEYGERRKGTTGGFKLVREETTTIDFLPFVDLHAKRWAGRYWGISELSRNWTIFDEINNRWSDMAEVLEYHGKPVLQVPASVMRNNVVEKGADRAIAIRNAQDADIARYITYDGMIDSQIAALDKLVEHAFLVSECPPSYFGFAEGMSLSGTALKLRLQNFVKKATRWQWGVTGQMRRIGKMALVLDGQAEAGAPTVTHGEPLPIDEKEMSEIESKLVGNKPLSSRKTALKRLRRVDDVEEELAEIEADEEALAPPASAGVPPLPAPRGLSAAGITPIRPPEAAAGAGEQEA